MKRNDLILIITPFVLTALLIFVGYNLLTRGTPEAKVSLPPQTENIEILLEDETEKIFASAPTPATTYARVIGVPTNRSQLANSINSARESGFNTIYLSVNVDLNPDHSLTLTNVKQSSDENISRFVKKTINAAHQNGFHVILALTINATNVVTEPATFTKNYQDLVVKWAKLATEYGVSYFSPGITVGHPIYSKLAVADMNQLVKSVHSTTRRYYTGKIGAGFCCQETFAANPAGYNFISLIPTDDINLETLTAIADPVAKRAVMVNLFVYERTTSTVKEIKKYTY